MSKIVYTPLSKEELHQIKTGDIIERMLGFLIPTYVVVQDVNDGIIDAGWLFDRNTGQEIDDAIPLPVSYIRRILNDEQKQIIRNGGTLTYP